MAKERESSAAERALQDWRSGDAELAGLHERLRAGLPRGASIHLVGGAVRDCLRGHPEAAKDLDLVVSSANREALERALPGAARNCFDGLHLDTAGRPVDIWLLQHTWHIERFGLAPTWRNFLAGAPFNLDKAAWDLGTGRLREAGLLSGLADHIIDYAPRFPYLEAIQAARCVLLARRTGFALSGTAWDLLGRVAPQLGRGSAARADIDCFLADAHAMGSATARRGVIEEIRALGVQHSARRLAA